MGFEIDFIVPYEKKLLIAANTGTPYILQSALFSKFHKAIERICDDITARSASDRLFQARRRVEASVTAGQTDLNSSNEDN